MPGFARSALAGAATTARPTVVVSEALRAAPSEGAQVLTCEIAAHVQQTHGGEALGPRSERSPLFEGVLSGRWFGVRGLLRLARRRRAFLIYVPQHGLTKATLLRAMLITLVARPWRLDLVVLQQHTTPPPSLRRFAQSWRFVVATQQQEQALGGQGFVIGRLMPRVPSSKVSTAESKHVARQRVGWQPGTHYLHVGHARRGRNLRALAPLTEDGDLHLVLSAYRPVEEGSLPAADGHVDVHRGPCPDLADRYRAADVYVFPTFDMNEVIGLPMSVFEALANGTPVVARRSPALERWQDQAGITLVDSDAELLEVAEKTARAAAGADVLQPAAVATCLADLAPCQQGPR
ncbi:MAG: glycosyltransferase [Mycobacteriales bacterium]